MIYLSLSAQETDSDLQAKKGIYQKYLGWKKLSRLKGGCIVRLGTEWRQGDLSEGVGSRNTQQKYPVSAADMNEL